MQKLPTEPAAKLWELLRRNTTFRRKAAYLSRCNERWQQHLRRGEEWKKTRERDDLLVAPERARDRGFNLLRQLDEEVPFAAEALRWLVPQPLFIHRELALPADFDPAKEKCIPVTVRLGRGTVPDSSDDRHWKWFTGSAHRRGARARRDSPQSKANAAGWPDVWGPVVETVTTADERLAHSRHDGIAEWKDFFGSGRTFTVDSAWDEAPAPFQRAFGLQFEKAFGASSRPYETEFFQNWNLGTFITKAGETVAAADKCVSQLVDDLDRVRRGRPEKVCPPVPTKGGGAMRERPAFRLNVNETIQTRSFEFDDLSKLRVFAIPRPVTAGQVKDYFDRLAKHLAKDLPRERQLMGTPAFWTDFLAVEEIQCLTGASPDAAVRRYVCRAHAAGQIKANVHPPNQDIIFRWFDDGAMKPRPARDPALQEEWQQVHDVVVPILDVVVRDHGSTAKARIAFLNQLIAATFPHVDSETLLRKPPHKRTSGSRAAGRRSLP